MDDYYKSLTPLEDMVVSVWHFNEIGNEWVAKNSVTLVNTVKKDEDISRTKELHITNKAEVEALNDENLASISKDVFHETILPEDRI